MYTRILTPLDGSDVSEQVLPYARELASRLSLPTALLMAIEQEHPSHRTLSESRTTFPRNRYTSGRARPAILGLGCRPNERSRSNHKHGGASRGTRRHYRGRGRQRSQHPHSHGEPWPFRTCPLVDGQRGRQSATHSRQPALDHPVSITTRRVPVNSPERLIVPVDGSEVAEEVLPHVAYLASALQIPVELVQVTISETEYYQAMSMGLRVLPPTLPSFQTFSDRVEGEARAYVADVRARLTQQGVSDVEERLVQGSPAESICDLVTAHPNSLVAMTTHGRSGVGRMILGSVAERVVRQSGGPVLLVRASQEAAAPLAGSPSIA